MVAAVVLVGAHFAAAAVDAGDGHAILLALRHRRAKKCGARSVKVLAIGRAWGPGIAAFFDGAGLAAAFVFRAGDLLTLRVA